MKAYRIQRSCGFEHDVHIQEDLYIPELEVSFYSRTENMMALPTFGKATHEEMSKKMREDLIGASQGKTPKREYCISNRGEIELTKGDINNLERDICLHNFLKSQLEPINKRLTQKIFGP